MKKRFLARNGIIAGLGMIGLSLGAHTASATEPCGDFGECKTLVEINSTDGDIGFHFLVDGDDLTFTVLFDPNQMPLFSYSTWGPLREQTATEAFVESAEPLCFDPTLDDDDENDDERFVTLEQFIDRWTQGTYTFAALNIERETVQGETELTFDLPAAPTELAYDGAIITWAAGDDLGECADSDRLAGLVADGRLPEHPADVPVAAWEVVLEPDLEDGDPVADEVLTVRVSGEAEVLAVSVPLEYLSALPDDTPATLEIIAIGEGDNATATEIGDICLNEVQGCEDDGEDDEDDEDDSETEG